MSGLCRNGRSSLSYGSLQTVIPNMLHTSCSSFCISLLGQYSSSIIVFKSSQIIELEIARVKNLTWPFHHEKVESTYLHATYLTLKSSKQAQIAKLDSFFSNHLVWVTSLPFPRYVLGLQFINSLYEHSPWCPWFSHWLELLVPFPSPLLLLLICATVPVTTTWNTAESISGGGSGGGVGGVSVLFLRLFDFLCGIFLP